MKHYLVYYVHEERGHGEAYYSLRAKVCMPGITGLESKEELGRIAAQLNQQFDTPQSN